MFWEGLEDYDAEAGSSGLALEWEVRLLDRGRGAEGSLFGLLRLLARHFTPGVVMQQMLIKHLFFNFVIIIVVVIVVIANL